MGLAHSRPSFLGSHASAVRSNLRRILTPDLERSLSINLNATNNAPLTHKNTSCGDGSLERRLQGSFNPLCRVAATGQTSVGS